MLQQTQVDRVVPIYQTFTKAFPNFKSLAEAPLRDVLRLWSGLGYNRRALFLKRAAEIVVRDFDGKLPRTHEELVRLPGVGVNTAGAILTYAYNKPVVFIETNIRTVFIHHFLPKADRLSKKIHDKELLPFIEKTLDMKNPRVWYAALMDYGTHLKKTIGNTSRKSAHYTKQSKFKGSDRELRGKILKSLTQKSKTEKELQTALTVTKEKLSPVLKKLVREGLINESRGRFRIPA